MNPCLVGLESERLVRHLVDLRRACEWNHLAEVDPFAGLDGNTTISAIVV